MRIIYTFLIVFVLLIGITSATEMPSITNPIGLDDGEYTYTYEGNDISVNLLNIDSTTAAMRVMTNLDAPIFKFIDDGNEVPTILMAYAGDTNGNTMLDLQDFIVLANAYGSHKEDDKYTWIVDHDLDGSIGFSDYVMFLNMW